MNQEQLFDAFGERLYRYFRRVCPDADAEDLMQDVLIKALVEGIFTKFWIWRVAHNTLVNYIRSLGPRRKRNGALDEARDIPALDDPSMRLEEQERQGLLESALLHLDAEDRELILLRLEGFAWAQLAEIFGISLVALRRRYYRTLAGLREDVQQQSLGSYGRK